MEYVELYAIILEARANNDEVLEAHLLKGHGVSHTSWRPLSAS